MEKTGRRQFIQKSLGLTAGAIAIPSFLSYGQNQWSKGEDVLQQDKATTPVSVSKTGNTVHFFSGNIKNPVKLTFISDTHLHMDDERGAPYREYSNRMAGAYNETRHFETGKGTTPKEMFRETLKNAAEKKTDLLILGGDIFSFPSEAAIEWVMNELEQTGIPYIFTSGNHDWHYEGMKGSLDKLRDEWIERRLSPLYDDSNPLMIYRDIKGIRVLAIDNSTYEISEEQLAFFREQTSQNIPMILAVHIPMYAPGRRISFGCGHPDWGAATDKIHELERRPRWPESGHTQTTFDFHKAVFSSENLLGVFAGHTHSFSMDLINGKPQFVSDDNASGGFLDIHLDHLAEKDQKLI